MAANLSELQFHVMLCCVGLSGVDGHPTARDVVNAFIGKERQSRRTAAISSAHSPDSNFYQLPHSSHPDSGALRTALKQLVTDELAIAFSHGAWTLSPLGLDVLALRLAAERLDRSRGPRSEPVRW